MGQPNEFSGAQTPRRVKHSYTQSINATPERVFPLLCPVREIDWAPGWMPDWVISTSGLAERDCIFQTPAPADAKVASVWIITRHVAEAFEVDMYKVTPGHTVGKLEISLAPKDHTSTHAQIAYEFTSLGPAGEAFLQTFTAPWYKGFMCEWEKAMNHYLQTGTVLSE